MLPVGCRGLLMLAVWLYWSSVVLVTGAPSPTSSSVVPVDLIDEPDDDLPFPDLDKRAYSYVSSYKRLPVYNFGLGKRNKMAYSFGLGKRPQMYSFGLGKRINEDFEYPQMGKRPKEMYSFGLGKRDASEYDEDWDDEEVQDADDKRAGMYSFGLGKRRPYSFGLGKRSQGLYSFGLGKRAPMYGFGLGKRAPMYGFGLGKRAPMYGFGLGKRAPMYGFGLGKRPDYSAQRFNFGLGKRSLDDDPEDSDFEDKREVKPSELEAIRQEMKARSMENPTPSANREEEAAAEAEAEASLEDGSKVKRSPYSFGLGKKAYDFGLGKRPKQYSFGMGKRSEGEGMSQ